MGPAQRSHVPSVAVLRSFQRMRVAQGSDEGFAESIALIPSPARFSTRKGLFWTPVGPLALQINLSGKPTNQELEFGRSHWGLSLVRFLDLPARSLPSSAPAPLTETHHTLAAIGTNCSLAKLTRHASRDGPEMRPSFRCHAPTTTADGFFGSMQSHTRVFVVSFGWITSRTTPH